MNVSDYGSRVSNQLIPQTCIEALDLRKSPNAVEGHLSERKAGRPSVIIVRVEWIKAWKSLDRDGEEK